MSSTIAPILPSVALTYETTASLDASSDPAFTRNSDSSTVIYVVIGTVSGFGCILFIIVSVLYFQRKQAKIKTPNMHPFEFQMHQAVMSHSNIEMNGAGKSVESPSVEGLHHDRGEQDALAQDGADEADQDDEDDEDDEVEAMYNVMPAESTTMTPRKSVSKHDETPRI